LRLEKEYFGEVIKVNINEIAAKWWSDRFQIAEKREQFREALVAVLPDGDWVLQCDYDPKDLLLEAVQSVVECKGSFFSADELLPQKTVMRRDGDRLTAREGRGREWIDVRD
jgi:hypothetical protein